MDGVEYDVIISVQDDEVGCCAHRFIPIPPPPPRESGEQCYHSLLADGTLDRLRISKTGLVLYLLRAGEECPVISEFRKTGGLLLIP